MNSIKSFLYVKDLVHGFSIHGKLLISLIYVNDHNNDKHNSEYNILIL